MIAFAASLSFDVLKPWQYWKPKRGINTLKEIPKKIIPESILLHPPPLILKSPSKHIVGPLDTTLANIGRKKSKAPLTTFTP